MHACTLNSLPKMVKAELRCEAEGEVALGATCRGVRCLLTWHSRLQGMQSHQACNMPAGPAHSHAAATVSCPSRIPQSSAHLKVSPTKGSLPLKVRMFWAWREKSATNPLCMAMPGGACTSVRRNSLRRTGQGYVNGVLIDIRSAAFPEAGAIVALHNQHLPFCHTCTHARMQHEAMRTTSRPFKQ